MRTEEALFLHEEVMLLALKDEKGTVFAGTMYNYALGGAFLAELLMAKRIEVEAVKKKKYARVLSPGPLGDPLLDDCLAKIAGAKRRVQLQDWVAKFANLKNLKHRVAEQLAKRRILRVDEDKILGIFTRKIYPEIDPKPERAMIDRLRKAIFGEGGDVDPRTVILLSLASSADLLKHVLEKKEIKSRKARINELVAGEVIGQAARDAIAAARAAVVEVTVIPAVLVSTTVGQ